MVKRETKIGIILGIILVFLYGLVPIVANSRPIELDDHIFAGMVCLIQSVIFLPTRKVTIAFLNKFKM